MTTIKEIAEKSGYSPATVSRLLNNDTNLSITADTKNKILEIANQLGYWKNHERKKLKPTIALLYRDDDTEQLQDEYFTSLKDKVNEITKREKLEIHTFHDIFELIKKATNFQGFIAIGTNKPEILEMKRLHEVLPNGVFIDTNPMPKLFDTVKPNLALTVEDAVDRVVEAGYKRVGFLGISEKLNHMRDVRNVAFNECMWKFADKIEDNYEIVYAKQYSVEEGYRSGKKFLEDMKNDKVKLPDVIISASDTLTAGLLQAFNEKGINVPKDIAVVSINNSKVANFVSPPLSSYNVDQDKMVELAMQLLIDHIMDPKRQPVEMLLNTELVVRKSFVPKGR